MSTNVIKFFELKAREHVFAYREQPNFEKMFTKSQKTYRCPNKKNLISSQPTTTQIMKCSFNIYKMCRKQVNIMINNYQLYAKIQ